MGEIDYMAFLEDIVKMIISDEAEVKVEKKQEGEDKVVLYLSVPSSERGKVIGKEGKTINALRVLLKIMGAKNKERVGIDIVE